MLQTPNSTQEKHDMELEDMKEVDLEQPDLADSLGLHDFEANFSNLKSRKARANLAWKNVGFQVGEKEILRNVSGHAKAGECCALIGPSGAGKSSLLSILAGRVKTNKKKVVTGSVFVNGEEIDPKEYRTHIAYVLQEDNLFPTATARESLEFSAKLRLPASISNEKRKEIVDDLLQSLGLTAVQDTMVGSELVRGLSGGEKKRVAIAVELVTQPTMIFLDEPTSGLDSFSAIKVIKILSSLAKMAHTSVLCTIHQPSAEIFSIFDKTMILVKGNVMFNGSVQELPDVFEKAGTPIPTRTNPADFVMLLAQTRPLEKLPSYNPDNDRDVAQDTIEEDVSGLEKVSKHKALQTANYFRQTYELFMREAKNVFRDRTAFIAMVAVTVFLNLLMGVIFLQAANPNEDGYTIMTHFGALTLVFTSAMFGAAQGPLLTFPLERAIMIREYQTGTYSATPYFLSKFMVELPEYLFTSFIIMIVTYWLVGFQGEFFVLWLEVWLLMIAASSYAFVLGAAVNNAKQAQQMAPVVLVPQLLFTGFFISINQIPTWLQWVQYLCALKFGVNLGAITEFKDCGAACQAIVWDRNDINPDLAWVYALVLVAIGVGFRIISLGILVYRSKNFSQ